MVSRREWRLGNNVACFATFVCKFFFILSVFSSSHTHLFWRIVYYFHHVTTIFLALSETKYLLATPTVTHISEVTEEFYVRTYGTLVDVGKSRQKKMCRDQNCVGATGAFWPKVTTFGCRGDMSPTCRRLSQPSDAPHVIPLHRHGHRNRRRFACIFVVVDFVVGHNHKLKTMLWSI